MQNNNEIVLDHGCRSRMSTAFFLATLPFGIYNRRKTYNKIESGVKKWEYILIRITEVLQRIKTVRFMLIKPVC